MCCSLSIFVAVMLNFTGRVNSIPLYRDPVSFLQASIVETVSDRTN